MSKNNFNTPSLQTIWLCRHGNRLDFVDPTKKCVDPPLSPDGEIQARETGTRLRGENIRHIFASPFLRTVQTAHYIADALDLPLKIEHGACEWMNVNWFTSAPSFLPLEELQKRFPRIDTAYASKVHPRHPETSEEMIVRCRKTADLLLSAFDSSFLIVGHGASVAGLTEALLGRKPASACSGLCSLTKIVRRDGKSTLELEGDTSHLSGGEAHRGKMI